MSVRVQRAYAPMRLFVCLCAQVYACVRTLALMCACACFNLSVIELHVSIIGMRALGVNLCVLADKYACLHVRVCAQS